MTETPSRNFDPEDFDFDESGVTESEYYNALNSLEERSFVKGVRHSLPLNSIRVIVDAHTDLVFSTDSYELPEGVVIRDVHFNENEAYISLRTTRWLCTLEDEEEFFNGNYSHEAMAYLVGELELFEEVSETALFQPDCVEEFFVEATFVEPLESFGVFDTLLTVMGYAIEEVEIRNEGIVRALFSFDETRPFTMDSIQDFQEMKLQNAMKGRVENSPPVTLPSGEEAQPGIYMIADLRDSMLDRFPSVKIDAPDDADVDEISCFELSVEDLNAAFVNVEDWPENTEPVDCDDESTAAVIRHGYGCSETSTLYLFASSNAEYVLYGDTVDEVEEVVEYQAQFTVSEMDYTYTFDLVNRAARDE